MVSGGHSNAFGYAGEGNKDRVSANGGGYQNTLLGVTAQTGDGANTVVREPDGTPVALGVGGASYYFVADRQGSTISLVEAHGVPRNAYTYDPFGNARTATEAVASPYQYIGGQYDTTTGLYHLQARYYDPTLGRFTQPDPSGQETNTYLYSSANPIMMSDPTGLYGWSDFGSDVGGTVGGVVAGAIVGAACKASLGFGCLAAGAVAGAAFSGAGAAISTKALGGTNSEAADNGISGAVGGFLGGGVGAYGGSKLTGLFNRS